MDVEIRTSDSAWAAQHGRPGRDGRTVVTVAAAEPVMFAGVAMVRFRLAEPPTDALNPWTMVPATWVC